MTPEEIMSRPPYRLTREQQETYFAKGFVLVEDIVPPDLLAELRKVTAALVEASRNDAESGPLYDIAPEHTAEAPKVRRFKRPVEMHEIYWRYASGFLADIAMDIVGPDVRFHHAKLNFKWCYDGDGSSDAVEWHQDIQFYPHTNYSPMTIGTYFEDTGEAEGAMRMIPGSHEGPLYDLYDSEGRWTGHVWPEEAKTLDAQKSELLCVPAGGLTIHNCRTLHASSPSQSPAARPLLLNAYASADAFPYTPHPTPTEHSGELVRGQRAQFAHHDPRPCPIPPDWSGGYTSIFAAQAGEDGSGERPAG